MYNIAGNLAVLFDILVFDKKKNSIFLQFELIMILTFFQANPGNFILQSNPSNM